MGRITVDELLLHKACEMFSAAMITTDTEILELREDIPIGGSSVYFLFSEEARCLAQQLYAEEMGWA